MIYYGIALLIIALDQWTKWLVVKNMELGERIPVLEPYLGWLSHRNRGAGVGDARRANVAVYRYHCRGDCGDSLLFP